MQLHLIEHDLRIIRNNAAGMSVPDLTVVLSCSIILVLVRISRILSHTEGEDFPPTVFAKVYATVSPEFLRAIHCAIFVLHQCGHRLDVPDPLPSLELRSSDYVHLMDEVANHISR
jgi:hypothetical protein